VLQFAPIFDRKFEHGAGTEESLQDRPATSQPIPIIFKGKFMASPFANDLVEPRMKLLFWSQLFEGRDDFHRVPLNPIKLPTLMIEAVKCVFAMPVRRHRVEKRAQFVEPRFNRNQERL
jgi:hypothetical protein